MAASCTPFRTSAVSNYTNVPISPGKTPHWSPGIRIQPCFQRPVKAISCSAQTNNSSPTLRTCKNCKNQFDPLQNHPRACRYHTAHFGGETKRKFESVYSGGTMNTPESGKILQYWHCCGCEDPFDPGCIAAPHSSYDD